MLHQDVVQKTNGRDRNANGFNENNINVRWEAAVKCHRELLPYMIIFDPADQLLLPEQLCDYINGTKLCHSLAESGGAQGGEPFTCTSSQCFESSADSHGHPVRRVFPGLRGGTRENLKWLTGCTVALCAERSLTWMSQSLLYLHK